MGAGMAMMNAEPMKAGSPLRLAESGFVAADVSGLRKAAILMVALGDEMAKTLFQSLTERDVARVTHEITQLGEIPQAQLTQVMTEFFGLLETQQYVVRGGAEYALKLLTEAFGAQKAQQLLVQVGRVRERATGDLAMLQKMEPQQLSKFLEKIEAKEPELAIGIRNLMFTFEDLVTVPMQSIRELVGAADKKVLAMALKGAQDNVKAHIFQAMSSRAVDMMKDDMEAIGPVRSKDVVAAKQVLLTLARTMESEGKIILKLEADDDFSV
jgi:flagellar motor switch protein FliG